MGLAIAEAFANAGAEVELVIGPSHLVAMHPKIRRTDVVTAQQMYEACLKIFPQVDVAILSAAVADYSVKELSTQKIKKSDEELTLTLVKNKDILATLGSIKRENQILGGFSLETHNELEFAKHKLIKKNCNFIVLNSLRDEGAGFGVDTNKVSIITKDNLTEYALKSKSEVAQDIVEFVAITYFGYKIE